MGTSLGGVNDQNLTNHDQDAGSAQHFECRRRFRNKEEVAEMAEAGPIKKVPKSDNPKRRATPKSAAKIPKLSIKNCRRRAERRKRRRPGEQ